MAKLTKAEFNQQSKSNVLLPPVSDKDKKDMITRVYNWQQAEGIYAWDEASFK